MVLDVNKKIEELHTKGNEWGCDICDHFPLMLKYGSQCSHITEMGVRNGISTWGWVGSKPQTLICYDIEDSPIQDIKDTALNLGIDFQFYKADTREIEIEETDLLFIDTEHNYDQIQKELSLHGNKVRKFIVFHDTVSSPSINEAIKEFMEANPHWVDEEEVTNNNGFKIIKKI